MIIEQANYGNKNKFLSIQFLTNNLIIFITMKQFFAILFLSVITLIGYSQENLVTVAGGYSFASFDGSDYSDTKTKVSGWRINGLY